MKQSTLTINNGPIKWKVNWNGVDTILLDMDGTLLDKHFDDYFWETYIPEQYALQNAMSISEARQELLQRYKKMEGTLAWTDLDYWSEELGLDIPALKMQVDQLIAVHPYVVDFLKYCRAIGKKIHLVTNAHGKTLAIKMRKTAIGDYFNRIVCAAEVGMAKEETAFWQDLERILDFDRRRTLLADDNENVLLAARDFGMGVLLFVARPSSKAPVHYSSLFPSIVYFKELMV